MTGAVAARITPFERPSSYRAIARKYRPKTFKELIGQETTVQILVNGLQSGRLPQALLFTGTRGVGKTTLARLLARALNCNGRDLTQTVEPCGACEHCQAIYEDRHLDVIEMDAASHTSVDDIREIIEAARYKAVSAKYKIYIIDEVHMLSKSAFNALLKTLEEPPAHVIFIFATTEVRRLPKTVVSRCMQFHLQRLSLSTLGRHFQEVAKAEGHSIDEQAALLIARAADGSVRDGMSLLDQILTLSQGQITAELVRNTLGFADQGALVRLWKESIQGNIKPALEIANGLYYGGADPHAILSDLLALTHKIALYKAAPEVAQEGTWSEEERSLCQDLNGILTIPTLTRIWHILMNGAKEVHHLNTAASLPALHMVLIRLAYASALPTPHTIIQNFFQSPEIKQEPILQPATADSVKVDINNETGYTLPIITGFDDVVRLCLEKREPLLSAALKNDVHLVSFGPGTLDLHLTERAPQDLARRLERLLTEWTGEKWRVITAQEGAVLQPTLSEREQTERERLLQEVSQHPFVAEALERFPGAAIQSVQPLVNEK